MVWRFVALGGCGGPGSSPAQTTAGTPPGHRAEPFLDPDPLAEGLTGAWRPAHERAAGFDGTTFSFDGLWDPPVGYVP